VYSFEHTAAEFPMNGNQNAWDTCPERDRLLKDKNIALGEYAERAFALFQDASGGRHLYRLLLNEATKAQYAAQKAEAAFAKHIGEHGCR
jgi:hypothetical protein